MIDPKIIKHRWLLAACILAFIAQGCGHSGQGARNRGSVFHYNQPNDISSLDPAFAKSLNNMWAVDHLYNQLIDLDESLRLRPEIAKSWSVDKTGLVYRFAIDRSYVFAEDPCFGPKGSRPVSAYDVEFSLKRLLDWNLASPGAWLFQGKIDSVRGFTAVNDSLFQITLSRPFSPLLHVLTMHYCSVVPKEAIDFYGLDFRKRPVGTGPFYLYKWVERQDMFLRKNPKYLFSEKVLLDGVRISFIEDRNTAYLEFLKGNIDFFSGIQSSFAYQLVDKNGQLRTDKIERMNLLASDFLNVEYIGINFGGLRPNHPLRNHLVRQAMDYAIDKKMLVKSFRFNRATPAEHGFIPKGLPAFIEDSSLARRFDMRKAKALMAASGVKWELEPPIAVRTNKDYVDIVTIVARQWEDLGIPVKIELMETATLRESMRSGNVELFRGSWIADYPDEESFLAFFYGKNPAPPNYTRYRNSTFDKMYEECLSTQDPTKRLALYKAMNKIIHDDAPVFPLFYDQTCWFAQKEIHGLTPNPFNMLKLDGVYKNSKN